jgi:hypothetical protein
VPPDATPQPGPSEIVSTRSVSGQFVVYAPASGTRPIPPDIAADTSHVRLDPVLATVACERMKQALWRELGAAGSWRGKIHLRLHPVQALAEEVLLAAELFRDGWRYTIDCPDFVESSRFVRSVVHALLLEMANRAAVERSAEIPLWLIEGFTQELIASIGDEIFLGPSASGRTAGVSIRSTYVEKQNPNSLKAAHLELSVHPPLTFEKLSWPTEGDLEGLASARYRYSAQLFVSELLRLDRGRTCVLGMIEQLPRNLNWQFAFIRSFNPHFQRLLDVEKWWALRASHFIGRDLTQYWTPAESCRRLAEALGPTVHVRSTENELPMPAEVSLQAIIRDWDLPIQIQVLKEKTRELEVLRLRVAADLAPLVEEYRLTLENYLQQAIKKPLPLPFFRKGPLRRAASAAIQKLDALDARRLAFDHNKPGTP